MTGITKLVLGGFVISAGTIGTYGTHRYFFTPTDIKDAIYKNGLELLDLETPITTSSTDTQSYKRWKELIGISGNETTAKDFSGWESQDNESVKIEKMRKKCYEEMNIKYKDDNFWAKFEKTKKFCTKNKSDN